MSFTQVVGLIAFTLTFGAVLVFAFDRHPAEHEIREESALASVSRMAPLASSEPSASNLRTEGEQRPPAGYGVARNKLGSMPGVAREVKFEICGRVRRNCVVDGDTFWFRGEKVRIADIDTPEIRRPRCVSERRLGLAATVRLVELLNDGPFELQQVGDRSVDRYGRKLLLVVRNGSSLGDQLVSEGLAHRWIGKKVSWCN